MIPAFTDHLWQSTMFVLAAALVAAALRQNGAHIRHRIWLVASLKFLVPLSLLMNLGGALPWIGSGTTVTTASAVPDLSITVDRIAQPFTSDVFFLSAVTNEHTETNWVTMAIVGVWACGFVVVALMRYRGWRRVRAALRTSAPVPVVAPLPVLSSPGLLEPGVVGLWHPMINRIGLQLSAARRTALIAAAVLAVGLPVAAGVVIAPLGTSAFVEASADKQQNFDVASIKPCAPDSGLAPGMRGPAGVTSPGYLHLPCMTLRQLLNIASGNSDNVLNAHFRNRQDGDFVAVRGGPAWVASDRFTIEARAAGVTDRKTLQGPPLLALLVDRFQLVFHRATEDRDVYAMTVAAGGLKLTPVAPGACWELDPANVPSTAESRGGRMPCGMLMSTAPFRAIGARIGKSPLAMGTALSDFLSSLMDRPVVDKTGLDARYDVTFDYMLNEATPGAIERLQRSREGGPPRALPTTGGPPIFRALENLGLKLTPAKEPVEYLVIDRVEKLRPDSPAESAIEAPAGPNRSRGPR